MEQSTKIYNRKDDRDDFEDRNDEPTTSKADFNDPNCAAHNTNDSKTLQALDFNSADDVRLAMKVLTEEIPHHDETANQPISEELNAEFKIKGDQSDHKKSEKIPVNFNSEVKNITSKGVNRTKPAPQHKESRPERAKAKKRKARASKPKPAKRYKGTSVQGFYWGKLSNLIFLRNSYRSDSSSEDSFFSL